MPVLDLSTIPSPRPTAGKLILTISKPATQSDLIAEMRLKELDPTVEIVVSDNPRLSTPRLNAMEYDRSVYRGLDSILGFVADLREEIRG